MAAYVIHNQLEVTEPDAWAEYGSKIRAQMADYGGRILVAEASATVLEGEWRGTGNVIAARVATWEATLAPRGIGRHD
jgi:uncharacterized protein (DUF1330 family)